MTDPTQTLAPEQSSCCSSTPEPVPTASSCCGASTANPAPVGIRRVHLLAPTAQETAVCPVMGGTAVKENAEAAGLYRDYEGTRYWFCCPGCAPTFDAYPARYAAAA